MKKILPITIVIIIGAVVFYTFQSSTGTYKENLEKEREQILYNFRNSSSSPFAGIDKPEIISYYPVDESYKVQGEIKLVEKHTPFVLQTNDKIKLIYVKYAIVSFQVLGTDQTLTIYQNEQDPSDFLIPFKDQTSGNETYGAGRYLPIRENIVDGHHITLDFNKAHNPYCAYNENYSCPIPPKENFLPIRIEAGERTYH